jgi:hypothetical protein
LIVIEKNSQVCNVGDDGIEKKKHSGCLIVIEKNILEFASLGDDGIEKKNALGV